jgi:hypothetical protein
LVWIDIGIARHSGFVDMFVSELLESLRPLPWRYRIVGIATASAILFCLVWWAGAAVISGLRYVQQTLGLWPL